MKGQLTVPTELIIDLLKMIINVGFFVGFILLFTTFYINVVKEDEQRLAFDFAQVLVKNYCLVYEKGFKHSFILDSKKLENLELCVNSERGFKIEDGKNEWSYNFKEGKFLKFPVVIKYENEIRFGVLKVNYE